MVVVTVFVFCVHIFPLPLLVVPGDSGDYFAQAFSDCLTPTSISLVDASAVLTLSHQAPPTVTSDAVVRPNSAKVKKCTVCKRSG